MYLRVLIVSILSFPMFSISAEADIFDRIDRCEDRGGGACVFDLLRELARGGNGGGNGEVECGCLGATLHCSIKRGDGTKVPFSNDVQLEDATECADMLRIARRKNRFCQDDTLVLVDSYNLELRRTRNYDSYGYCLILAFNDDITSRIELPELTCRDRNSNGTGWYARQAGCATNGVGCWFPNGGCNSNGTGCYLPGGYCASNGTGCYFEGRQIASKLYRCSR